MEALKKTPRSTVIILSASLIVPFIGFISPSAIKYLYYDIHLLKKLQIYRLLTAIFLTTFDINIIFSLLTRYQICKNIENSSIEIRTAENRGNSRNRHRTVKISDELLFFTFAFIIPLFFSNILQELTTFSESINMAYIKFFCSSLAPGSFIDFFGFQIEAKSFPYYYFLYELLLSKMQTKCYYGFVYAACYVHLRREFCFVPECFLDFIDYVEKIVLKIKNEINRRRRFGGPGRKLNRKRA